MVMKGKIRDRLQSLTTEFESGQKMLVDLKAKQANLRETLLRISGAIQVLEELIAEEGDSAASADNGLSANTTVASVPALKTETARP